MCARQPIKVPSHLVVGISSKTAHIDNPKVYHKESYNLQMSHYRKSKFAASMLTTTTSVFTLPFITEGEKFHISWESRKLLHMVQEEKPLSVSGFKNRQVSDK